MKYDFTSEFLWRRLAHADQFHFEDQGRVRRDQALPARSIAEIGRDDQLSLSADFHRHQALVPSFNHASDADGEIDGLIPMLTGTVEHRSILQPAGVMNAHDFSWRWAFPGSDDLVNIFQPGAG